MPRKTRLPFPRSLVALALSATLLLSACTAEPETSGSDSPATGTSTATSAPSLPDDPDSPLRTERAEEFTEAAAAEETVRIADEIQDLIDPSTILNVDDHPEVLSTEDGAAYYGVLRLVSITEGADPTLLARVLVSQLGAAGWTEVNTEDTDGSYFVALASSDSESDSWFLLVGGDTSEEGFPAITIQLASPTIP